MIGGDHVVQYAQAVALLCLKQPVEPAFAVPGKLQEELPLVALMGYVSGVSGQVVSFGSGHAPLPLSLDGQFPYLKQGLKPEKSPVLEVFS